MLLLLVAAYARISIYLFYRLHAFDEVYEFEFSASIQSKMPI